MPRCVTPFETRQRSFSTTDRRRRRWRRRWRRRMRYGCPMRLLDAAADAEQQVLPRCLLILHLLRLRNRMTLMDGGTDGMTSGRPEGWLHGGSVLVEQLTRPTSDHLPPEKRVSTSRRTRPWSVTCFYRHRPSPAMRTRSTRREGRSVRLQP